MKMEGRAYWSFFRAVCLHAFGPQLRARHMYMRNTFIFPEDTAVPCCPFCSMPHGDSGDRMCDFCGWGQPADDALTSTHPFFQKIARHITILMLPWTALALRRYFALKDYPISHTKCYGCETFCLRDDAHPVCEDKVSRHSRHQKNAVIACTQPWCRRERFGWLRCGMCGDYACGTCVRICDACNRPGSCRRCATTYECQDEDSSSDEDCGEYCAWHAPPRFPFQQRNYLGEDKWLKLYCRKHYDGWRTFYEVRECAQCALPVDKGGGVEICIISGCVNAVCSHTDSYAAGETRCGSCQHAKRVKVC